MPHLPINHPLRPFYQLLAAIAGLYVLIFGITGVIKTNDLGFFAQDGLPRVLGLQANTAFASLSIVVGAVLLVMKIIGGNLDRSVNLAGGVVFIFAGIIMLGLLRTSANFLGFTVATCIVSFIIGMTMLVAGLYGKVGPTRHAALEEQRRHGGVDTPPRRQPQGM